MCESKWDKHSSHFLNKIPLIEVWTMLLGTFLFLKAHLLPTIGKGMSTSLARKKQNRTKYDLCTNPISLKHNTSLLFLLKKCWLPNWCTIKEIADIKIATLSKIFLIWQLIYYPRACRHPHCYSVQYYVYITMYTLCQNTFTTHLIHYPIACLIYQLMHYWREYWYSNEYSLKHVLLVNIFLKESVVSESCQSCENPSLRNRNSFDGCHIFILFAFFVRIWTSWWVWYIGQEISSYLTAKLFSVMS